MDRRSMSRQYAEQGFPLGRVHAATAAIGSNNSNHAVGSSNAIKNMSKTILDRLHDRKSRFAGINLTERDIEEILADAAGSLDLDLSGASLVEDIPFFVADCISRYSYFEFVHVNLNSTSLSLRGYEVLMELVAQFRDLETLSLRNNSLQQDAGMAIAKIIGSRGKLQILDIRDNFLGDAGLAVIAGSLTADISSTRHLRSSLLSLSVIDLSSNHIGDSGLLALCRGLIHFAKHLATIDKVSSLKVLRLNKNNLGEKSALCLSQLLQTSREIGSLLIEELSLDDNQIGPAGFSALFHAVSRHEPEGRDNTDAILDFESNLVDMRRTSGQYNEELPTNKLKGGSLLVLSLARCRPDLSVLEEFASLLRHGSLLKSLDMSMSRHVARDMSQQPGFVECVVTLAEGVANNAHIETVMLGDLLEVCNTAAVIAATNSYQHAAIKRAIDALNSINALLKLDTAQQRLNWYAKHYFGGSDPLISSAEDPAKQLTPLKSDQTAMDDRALSSRSARKGDGTGAPEAVTLHRAEFEKIRRDHVDAFSVLSSEIQKLQQTKLRDLRDASSDDQDKSPREDNSRYSGRDREERYDSRTDDNSLNGSNRKIPGLHFSHMRSTGSGDRVLRDPVFSNKGPSESAVRNSASPERRKADGTRLYDEASVQTLIKAAVNSALQFQSGMPAAQNGLDAAPGNTGSSLAPTTLSATQHELFSSRLSIIEDRIEGIEVLQTGQHIETVSIEKYQALQTTVSKLEGRLKVVEEYMLRVDQERKLEDEQHRRDQNALKEYIIKMEDTQQKLLARMNDLELTLEEDSATSISLLDILMKKLNSGNSEIAPPEYMNVPELSPRRSFSQVEQPQEQTRTRGRSSNTTTNNGSVFNNTSNVYQSNVQQGKRMKR